MSKEKFAIEVDQETYELLERYAKKEGLTVRDFASKLIRDLYDSVTSKLKR